MQGPEFITEVPAVANYFINGAGAPANGSSYVHLFDTAGILQHNDIGPLYHPTDVGHVKVASHLMRYLHDNFGWELLSTGPEVQSHTLYWNDEPNY